ncbi:type II toxin-antitoxin system VapC family toxin [candidate division WOR-3 bacterium]|nr:type II toxin-antitoxin system VapC family toxin [candidate division WOR-3 bacterium]
MILVDTSVWVSHLRDGDSLLEDLLNRGMVVCHPFVVGELACGNLNKRSEILTLLNALPFAKVATHEEVMEFIDLRYLMGKGLRYVDVHLLSSAMLSETPIFTYDRKLHGIAAKLNISYKK